MNQRNKKNDTTEDALQEIASILKILTFSQVKESLERILPENNLAKRLAYELLDKDRPQSEIAMIVKRSLPKSKTTQSTISKWCSSWEKLGLVRKDSKDNYIKCFSLSDYDINVPRAIITDEENT